MELYKYKDLDEYRKVQEAGNIRKINRSGISEDTIKYISDYIKKRIKNISLGICHGTRRGYEQQFFKKHLNIEIIGTEISSTATQFPDTIQWDFHETKDEWINNVDFIFSNAFDHSYNPKLALSRWLSCLKDDGLCFIFYTKWDLKATRLDPFGATPREYKRLIKKVGVLHDVVLKTKISRLFIVKKKINLK